MSFVKPKDGYSIYTKSNCKYCRNVKKLIPNAHVISADDYLTSRRSNFLAFVDEMTGERPRTFPMVFLNKRYIGGFTETKDYIDKLEAFNFTDF
jgi:glutaredoxin